MLSFCLAVAMSSAASAASPPLEQEVDGAVRAFQPYWSPAQGTLRGRVVAIDPAPPSSVARPSRAAEELALLTAGHLHHHVTAAGGVPVLTTVDRASIATAFEREVQRRVRLIREACAELSGLGKRGLAPSAPRLAMSAMPFREVPVPFRRGLLYISIVADPSIQHARVTVANGQSTDVAAPSVHLARGMLAALGRPETEVRRFDSQGGVLAALTDRATAVAAACEIHLPCPAGPSPEVPAIRMLSRTHARAICNGLVRFCEAKRLPTDPGRSSGSGASDDPAPRTGTVRDGLSGLAASIWPDGLLPPDKVDWFCRAFARASITNPSLIYFDVSASLRGGETVLAGSTNAPQVIDGLVAALRELGIESVRRDVRVLPDRARLGEECFGVCRAPTALTRREPGGTAGPQTQLLYGEPVFLLDRTEHAYLLHAGDGYWGWVDRDAIQPMTAERFAARLACRQGVLVGDFDDGRLVIPRGARVTLPGDGPPGRVLLPDGSEADIPAELVRCDAQAQAAAAARVRAALDLVNTPYVFGGRSPLGLDCSGLVTNVWARAGQTAARDAWQQAFDGALVATWWHREGMRPGDHVFFIDAAGKIYHTGVAVSPTHVVHASPPGVRIASLRPGDRLYDARLDRDYFLTKRP